MRIYLDVCCLNRAFDDQTQRRIRLETEAIDAILDLCLDGTHVWVASAAVEEELARDPDVRRRVQSLALLQDAGEVAKPNGDTRRRAEEIAATGVAMIDSLHLALAEAALCDALLTTDDEFVHRSGRLHPASRVRVRNPLEWWMENVS